ncbi:MAG: hypothetical protein IJN85_02715, partial [Oscillospiraceae bacterium]|nr:hypothetical protein [Oscillospiraceae bacterium]
TFNKEEGSSIDSLGYKCVKIDYFTTADMTQVENPETVSFSNKASFNGTTAPPDNTYEVEVYDPDKQPYSKTAINSSGETIDEIGLNQLEKTKITIDNKEYYIFGWKINFDEYTSFTFKMVDKFPTGHTLVTEQPYAPYRYHDDYNKGYLTWHKEAWDTNYVYTYENNADNFTLWGFNKSNVTYITYYTKVPVEELKPSVETAGDEGIKISNSITESTNTYNPVKAEVTVVPEIEVEEPTEEPTDGPSEETRTELIDKKYKLREGATSENADQGNNNISYTIDINPEAKDLANGDELILNDNFVLKGYSTDGGYNWTNGLNVADVFLNSVKVFEIVPDGPPTELSSSEYSYQFIANPDTRAPAQVEVKRPRGDNKFWTAENLQLGDIVTITIKKEPGFVLNRLDEWNNSSNELHVTIKGYGYNDIDYLINPEPITFDSNGEYILTYTIPRGYNNIEVNSWNTPFENVTMSVQRKTTTSELKFVLPDAKALRVEYTLKLMQDGERPKSQTKFKFDNSASLIGSTTTTDSSGETTLDILYGNAESSVDMIPKIKKVDVGDHTITGLDASFKLAKYSDSGWKWYSNALANEGTLESEYWSDDENAAVEINVNGTFGVKGLEAGSLYALIETKVPQKDNFNTYTYESEDKIKPFYFTYASSVSTFPKGVNGEEIVTSNVSTVQTGGNIEIANNRIIDVTVNKRWDNVLSDTSVEATLYWSYTKTLSGFPTEMYKATAAELGIDNLTNPATFESTHTWQGLPNGRNGKPIYYYVRETAYKVNEKIYTFDASDGCYKNGEEYGEYTPGYTGNAVNSSEAVVEILNSSALKVEKLWHDAKNNPMTSDMISA